MVVDDPSGNSYIENVLAPLADPQLKMRQYVRSHEHIAQLGLAVADATANAEDDSKVATEATATQMEVSEKDDIPEIHVFPANCSSCNAPGETKMHILDIPHFKQVVIMATSCEYCGYKTNEVKAGGAISEKGKRITLKVTDAEDLSRDILKSETCGLEIPEIDLELYAGTLGGRFTTVEGLLSEIKNQLGSRMSFLGGDSTSDETKVRFEEFLAKLEAVKSAQLPCTLILNDPMANSYLQNLYAPDPDPSITIEYYTRSWEDDEDLGLHHMNV